MFYMSIFISPIPGLFLSFLKWIFNGAKHKSEVHGLTYLLAFAGNGFFDQIFYKKNSKFFIFLKYCGKKVESLFYTKNSAFFTPFCFTPNILHFF